MVNEEYLNELAVISAVFSVLSIMVTIQTVITQRLIMSKQSFMVIEFDVKGQCIKRGMERKINGIKSEISSVLSVPGGAIDIEQGQYLSAGGFHMKMYVDSNENESNQYDKKLQEAIDNGMMALYFQKHWNLAAIPIITNMNNYRMGDEVEIAIKSESVSKNEDF